jgi:nucleoside-diphosphate-sugar epimerase
MSVSDKSEQKVHESLAGQRVLLVGGAGFIGHNLALRLREYGVDVAVLDNLAVNSLVDNVFGTTETGLKAAMNHYCLQERFKMLRDAGVRMINCDARHMGELGLVFLDYKPTKVVHLAAIASAVDANNDPGLMFDLQLIILRNILELCRLQHGEINQVMLLSSSTVYGDFEGNEVDESVRPRPQGIYANTKYMAERLLRTYARQYGIGATTIRPSALYGERCVSRRVSQKFIENALMGVPLLLEGGGEGRLDFTYIEDLADGMARALAFHKSNDDSNTFNLTFGRSRSIAELTAIVRELVPDALVEERPRANDKPIRGTLSTERAERLLGYKSQWPLEVGYRRYCEWYIKMWNSIKDGA